MIQNSHRSTIPILPFSNPKSSGNQKILIILWQQNLFWTDRRLLIVFIISLSVHIYTFCHRNINGFIYRNQTPLEMVWDTQMRYQIAFPKFKNSEFPQNLWPQQFRARFSRPVLRSLPTVIPWRSHLSPARPDFTSLIRWVWLPNTSP